MVAECHRWCPARIVSRAVPAFAHPKLSLIKGLRRLSRNVAFAVFEAADEPVVGCGDPADGAAGPRAWRVALDWQQLPVRRAAAQGLRDARLPPGVGRGERVARLDAPDGGLDTVLPDPDQPEPALRGWQANATPGRSTGRSAKRRSTAPSPRGSRINKKQTFCGQSRIASAVGSFISGDRKNASRSAAEPKAPRRWSGSTTAPLNRHSQ